MLSKDEWTNVNINDCYIIKTIGCFKISDLFQFSLIMIGMPNVCLYVSMIYLTFFSIFRQKQLKSGKKHRNSEEVRFPVVRFFRLLSPPCMIFKCDICSIFSISICVFYKTFKNSPFTIRTKEKNSYSPPSCAYYEVKNYIWTSLEGQTLTLNYFWGQGVHNLINFLSFCS